MCQDTGESILKGSQVRRGNLAEARLGTKARKLCPFGGGGCHPAAIQSTGDEGDELFS